MLKETSKEWNSNAGCGICRMSLLSVFREPLLSSGLSTQLLFGELYNIVHIGPDDQWVKIEGVESTGTGWIMASQHHPLSRDEFDFFVQSPRQIVSKGIGEIRLKDNTLLLLPGSQIHAGQNEIFEWEDSIKFNGTSHSFEEKASRAEIIATALTFLNAPFLPGGRSLFGLNASSWLNLVFKISGVILPNDLIAFKNIGKEGEVSAIQAGDLIVFGANQGSPFQAGLYMGEREILWVREKVKTGAFDPEKWDKNAALSGSIQLMAIKNLVD
ncbi:NlpC/P60 family protein [uncultured Cyclobacterium sp.]|uniref:NlpC/P60 family protein n=1 Tax=uncultured Cyclobacterium sp. TaxID=453820 RepID=UPI0030EB5C9A